MRAGREVPLSRESLWGVNTCAVVVRETFDQVAGQACWNDVKLAVSKSCLTVKTYNRGIVASKNFVGRSRFHY